MLSILNVDSHQLNRKYVVNLKVIQGFNALDETNIGPEPYNGFQILDSVIEWFTNCHHGISLLVAKLQKKIHHLIALLSLAVVTAKPSKFDLMSIVKRIFLNTNSVAQYRQIQDTTISTLFWKLLILIIHYLKFYERQEKFIQPERH